MKINILIMLWSKFEICFLKSTAKFKTQKNFYELVFIPGLVEICLQLFNIPFGILLLFTKVYVLYEWMSTNQKTKFTKKILIDEISFLNLYI